MDESKKKTILIGVIVVCTVATGAITYYINHEPKISVDPGIPKDATTWMFCRNPVCEHSFEMNLRGYYRFVEENSPPRILVAPPVSCSECDEPSCYRAIKCGK